MKKLFSFFIIGCMLLTVGCSHKTTTNTNIPTVEQEKTKLFDYKENLDDETFQEKELKSTERASNIIEVFEEKGKVRVDVYDELIDEFMLDRENLKVVKTQFLHYFIPYYDALAEDFSSKISDYQNILNKCTYDKNNKIIIPKEYINHEEFNQFIEDIEKCHLTFVKSNNTTNLVVDWNYFATRYKDVIDPMFLEVMKSYDINIRTSIYDEKYNLIESELFKIISECEKSLSIIQNNEQYLSYYTNFEKAILNILYYYYNIFFGYSGQQTFDKNTNYLLPEYLDRYNKYIEQYPNTKLSEIITIYLDKMYESEGKYKDNNLAKLYLYENISEKVQHYQYDANGNIIE